MTLPHLPACLLYPQVDFMTRHDNVDAAALAGCNTSLVASSTLAKLPPQEKHANRALSLGPDGKLCECW